jgi:hypothetical protein
LSLAEYWYNTSEHLALGKSPFEVLYGCSPRHFGITDESVLPVPNVATMLAERTTMMAAVRQHLLRAQQHMKAQADKGRLERSFEVIDSVFLQLQSYVQPLLAPRSHHKLCFKYFGPFKIVGKVGAVAYKLALQPSSAIHPVFHVSLLKPTPPSAPAIKAQLLDPRRHAPSPRARPADMSPTTWRQHHTTNADQVERPRR